MIPWFHFVDLAAIAIDEVHTALPDGHHDSRCAGRPRIRITDSDSPCVGRSSLVKLLDFGDISVDVPASWAGGGDVWIEDRGTRYAVGTIHFGDDESHELDGAVRAVDPGSRRNSATGGRGVGRWSACWN